MANGTTTPAAQASAAAAAKAKALKAAQKALRYQNNKDVAKYFAVGMAGIMALFIISHWTRFLYNKSHGSKRSDSKVGPLIVLTRVTRKLLIRNVAGFVSLGHVLVFMAFVATVLTVTLAIDWDRSQLQFLAHRLGWITAAILVFVIFLSLKNTPLAILTSYSYERLNFLHQLAGYSLLATTLAHMIVMAVAWGRKNNLKEFLLTKNVNGMVAGSAMIVILATTNILRTYQYETFHIIHMLMAALIIIVSAMHRPDYPMVGKIMIIAASMWIADRLFRLFKLLFYSFGNTATITALPHGGTRIVLRKTPMGAAPGKHCFLWIPGVRATECHPFTIVSTAPLEIVAAAYNGFTRDLYKHAKGNPGNALMASVDGPYGRAPDFTLYSKVLFIAGGSGASFTCGVALDVLRKLGDSTSTTIEFVWVVHEQVRIEWFAKELQGLAASPCVSLRIHSTHPLSDTAEHSHESTYSLQETKVPVSEVNSVYPGASESDVEKQPATTTSVLSTTFTVRQGRPNVPAIIAETVTGAAKHDNIVVAVCGPSGMMTDARAAVAANIKVDGPGLELHSKHFGW